MKKACFIEDTFEDGFHIFQVLSHCKSTIMVLWECLCIFNMFSEHCHLSGMYLQPHTCLHVGSFNGLGSSRFEDANALQHPQQIYCSLILSIASNHCSMESNTFHCQQDDFLSVRVHATYDERLELF